MTSIQSPKISTKHYITKIKYGLIVYSFFGTFWLLIFKYAWLIHIEYSPEIDIISLPMYENAIFGKYYGSTMEKTKLKDFLAATPYTIHFIIPWIFCIYLALCHRSNQKMNEIFILETGREKKIPNPIQFLGSMFCMNFLMVLTHICFPTAPPWYNADHGYHAANYTMHGSAAGLLRIDEALGSTFYKNMYNGGPITFGSFPSMHTGWPMMILYFQFTWLGRALSALHVVWIAWAALYLCHHWMIDIIGAAFYVFAGAMLSKLLWKYISKLAIVNSMKIRSQDMWKYEDIDTPL